MFSTKIDFVAPPFAGHLFPLLQLAAQLRELGFTNLRFLSTPESQRAVELMGFPMVALLEGKSHVVFQISDTPHRVGSNPVRMLRQLRLNLALMHDLRNQLQEDWSQTRPDLVIADLTCPVAGLLAQSMGHRWWTSTPTPCVVETGDGTPSYLGGWHPPKHQIGHLRDAVGRATIRRFKKTLHWLFRSQMQSLGVDKIYRDDGYETVYSNDTILALGVRDLEFARSWPPALVFTGPLTSSPPFPHEPPVFVDGKPHILISLGTHLWWAKDHARSLMKSVANAMPDHVFHFTSGRAAAENHSIEGNFHTYDYIPYNAHMHRYQLAINHGGTGVMYSCLRHGIPILAWPQDYDQFDHTARLVHHQLGIRCRPTINAIVEDLKTLSTDTRIRANVEAIQKTILQHKAAAIVVDRLSQS